MFLKNVIIYGDHASMTKKLVEIGLFDRDIDVFLAGAALGIIFEEKREKKTDQNNKVTIFLEQIGNEGDRIRYLASLAYLIENSHLKGNKESERELLNDTFSDWFRDDENKKKYDLLQEYALGGIEKLYDKIIGSSTNSEDYYINYYNFIKDIDNMKINSEDDRVIEAALL